MTHRTNLAVTITPALDSTKPAAPVPIAPSSRSFWGAVAAFLAAATAVIGWLHWNNPRLLGSWHGFLHTAIANRFSTLAAPPENPFFAGEPLPYYWFYHLLGYWLSQALTLDLLHTFHLISWISLAALTIAAALIGRRCFRSTFAGIAIAWLALAGINPLGPGIALAKHQLQGAPLADSTTLPVETVFVSDRLSDELITHSFLPAMYVTADWHYGQNLVWFFDISSRGPALAALMLLAYLIVTAEKSWRRYLAVAAVSALLAALNPVVGLAVAGLFAVLYLRQHPMLGIAALAGALLASPTYYHLFSRLSGQEGIQLHSSSIPPFVRAIANFSLLFPLALFGLRRNRSLLPVTLAGIVLLAVSILVYLPKGNEHSLSNAAQLLLAIPAGAAIGSIRRKPIAIALCAAFIPVTAGTLYAFAAPPPMPIATSGGLLHRLPADGDLERLYQWTRANTAPDAIFLIDPATPVKMSGDVSEFPAFTARTLFTEASKPAGQGSADLSTPYRDSAFRQQLAARAAHGEPLSATDRAYLARFHRPLYLLLYQPRDLSALYGAPQFQHGIATVYRIQP
jgi:hypothetical protein